MAIEKSVLSNNYIIGRDLEYDLFHLGAGGGDAKVNLDRYLIAPLELFSAEELADIWARASRLFKPAAVRE